MKKAFSLTGVCMLVLLLFASVQAQTTTQSLLNTSWTGNLTVINIDGSTTVLTGAVLTFTAQNGRFLSGALTQPAIVFSAVKEGFEREITMTAPNCRISADITGGGFHHEHDFDRSYTGQNMRIQGSNFADGSMFIGTLTRQ